MSWPSNVPHGNPVSEEIVLVVTNLPADISGLAGVPGRKNNTDRNGLSTLEALAEQVVAGTPRNMQESRSVSVKYDALHIPFTLVSYTIPGPDPADQSGLLELPRPMEVPGTGEDGEIRVSELPFPEATPGWGILPQRPSETIAKVSHDTPRHGEKTLADNIK